ncbi:dephospho-CoA kinase [Pseudomonadota bacterium]
MSRCEYRDRDRRPFIVILTGGVASGKTTVSSLFAKLGVPVIDADVIAREIVEPGRPALGRIVEFLGAAFLLEDGRLDRAKMRKAVFCQPGLKRKLEAILHPLIAQESTRKLQELTAPYCIMVIPLFAESSSGIEVDRVLVVDADRDTQLTRLVSRDKVDRDIAIAMLNAQATRWQRLELADDVIENNGSLAELQTCVETLHRKYLRLAGRGKAPANE